jgi:penicillin-binding protein 1A
MVRVRVDGNRGTETKSKGGLVEEVMEEYRLMLLGPEPQQLAGPAKGPTVKKKAADPARSAPKVVDDLF